MGSGARVWEMGEGKESEEVFWQPRPGGWQSVWVGPV